MGHFTPFLEPFHSVLLSRNEAWSQKYKTIFRKRKKAHRLTSLIYQLEIGQMKKRQPLLIELTESIAVKQERGKKKKWLTRIQNTRATLSIKRRERSTQEELIKGICPFIRISLLRLVFPPWLWAGSRSWSVGPSLISLSRLFFLPNQNTPASIKTRKFGQRVTCWNVRMWNFVIEIRLVISHTYRHLYWSG